MSVQRIAGRYAKSLIDLAVEKDTLDDVLHDVKIFQETLRNKDFFNLIKSPVISADKKRNVFKALFQDRIGGLSFIFVDIIIKKGRESILSEITQEFIAQYRSLKKITSARLITAVPATEELLAQVKSTIKGQGLATNEIELMTRIDKNIIGGFILEIEDSVYDASIKTKLAKVRKGILDNTQINSI